MEIVGAFRNIEDRLKLLALIGAAFFLQSGGCLATAATPLDSSFGNQGVVLSPKPRGGMVLALARDSKGGLLAAGAEIFERFALARFFPNGSIDTVFGTDGVVEEAVGAEASAQAVAVQDDKKIVVAGGTESAFVLTRYSADGTPDHTFGERGRVRTTVGVIDAAALALAIQPNGKILVGGYGVDASGDWTARLVGYRPNGTIDRHFGTRGSIGLVAGGRPVAISGLEILPTGKILISGDLDGGIFLARFYPSGKRDPSFGGGDGRVLVKVNGAQAEATALTLGRGNRPIVAGSLVDGRSESALLVGFLPSGRVDRTFGVDGAARTRRGSGLAILDAVADRNGALTATGFWTTSKTSEAKIAVLRYLPSGELDPTFAKAGFFTRDFGVESVGTSVLHQPDGRVVVAGRANRLGPEVSESPDVLNGAEYMLMRFLP